MTYLATEQEETVRATAAVVAALSPSDGTARPLCAALLAEAETVVAGATLGTRWAAISAALSADGLDVSAAELALDRLSAVTAAGGGAVAARTVAVCALLATLGAAVPGEPLRSVDEGEALMARISDRFAAVEDAIADVDDGAHWRAMIGLQAAITTYLAGTLRVLPRRRALRLSANLPSLAVAHLVYQDAGRAEEIATENGVVHPAFMPNELSVLSA
ncbi:hypothetical protein [Amorphus sp. 3PC139-8]|uniref:hypothetical protein n=1 Tax=Amorphus sp. 3PC139-8 TaxID=2735676 RepID=UPI00345D0403